VYVTSYLSGFACASLVWFCCLAPAGAQQAGTPPPAGASQPGSGQTAPDQDESSQEPDNGSSLMAVPELPKVPEVQMPGERGVSFGADGWSANPKPELEKGSFPYAYLGNIRMMGTPNAHQGFDGSVGIGLHNVLRVSYFSTRASGNVYAPSELGLITQVYLQGDYLATDYLLQNYKIAFDYLTWPYPVKTSRFRLKTIYQFQFFRIRAGFDAPLLPITDAYGNPLSDNNGNPLSYATRHTYQFFLPEFGLGGQYWVTRGFRLEAGGTGFSIPHHQNSWNFEGSANFRAGHYELRVGYRGFHFRSSAQQDFWMRGTMVGGFIGVRWYSDSMKK
jgi:hypothetical protein